VLLIKRYVTQGLHVNGVIVVVVVVVGVEVVVVVVVGAIVVVVVVVGGIHAFTNVQNMFCIERLFVIDPNTASARASGHNF
jgi:Na+(H+)/acetate symporter ActP